MVQITRYFCLTPERLEINISPQSILFENISLLPEGGIGLKIKQTVDLSTGKLVTGTPHHYRLVEFEAMKSSVRTQSSYKM